MPDKPSNDKDSLLELLKKLWLPVAGFIGAVTLAYNFYQLWLGDQATVTYFLAGGGLVVLVITLAWVGYKKISIEIPTIIISETQTKATREEKHLAYPQIYKLSRILLGGVLIGILAGAGVLIQHRRVLGEKLVVLVANFDGPEDVYGLHNEIVENLNADFSTESEVVIVPRKEVVTLDDGSSAARALGKRYLADIVIWGWYRPTENPKITLHVENLTNAQTSALQGIGIYEPQSTLAQLESFEIQEQLGSDTSRLISFFAGTIEYASGDYQAALDHYERILESTTSTFVNYSAVFFYSGYSNHMLGNYKRAIQDYGKAIEIDRQFTAAYNNRGIAYRNLKNYSLALQDFNTALEIDPNNEAAYSNRGTVPYALKNYEPAILDFSKAIEINADFSDAYYNRGTVYLALKDYDNAIQDLSSAIEINPNLEAAYNNRGIALDALGEHKKAIKDYSETIKINSKLEVAYNNRGAAYLDLGKFRYAIRDFSKAIEINPEYVEPYSNRGAAYYSLKDYDHAIQDYSKALDLDPEHEAAYNNRAAMYFILKDYERALQDYSRAIEIDPLYATAYKNRGLTYQKLGKTIEAEADFKKYEELTGEKP